MAIGPEIPNPSNEPPTDNPNIREQKVDAEQQKLREVKDPSTGNFVKLLKYTAIPIARAELI